MSNSNVFMPASFAQKIDNASLLRLREQGVVTKSGVTLDEEKLKDVEYGETVIGTLTEEEAELYAFYVDAHESFQKLKRKIGATALHRMGDAMDGGIEPNTLDAMQILQEESALEVFSSERRMEYLKSMFFWVIGEKYKAHDFILGIRTKRRIVKHSRKW